MRRLLLSVALAGLLALMASPLATADTADTPDNEAIAPAPVAVQRVSLSSMGLRDEAAMVLVGTALIGLAAAVRRAA